MLQVATSVLHINGAVITDQNAASDYVRFLGPSQWRELAFDDIFALDWRHPGDQAAFWRHRARKCAEVLLPHSVDAKFLTGAYVIDANAGARLAGLGFPLAVTVDPLLFFR